MERQGIAQYGALEPLLTEAGIQTPQARAALRALPFRVLGPAQRRTLLDLRERWQSELNAALKAGPVLMHKEVPTARTPALLRPGSYWTWNQAVRGLGSAAEAYGRLALGYPGTGFDPGAPERYWITMPVDAAMARSFGVPLTGEAVLLTTLPTGPAAWPFPSTMNGFAASVTGFVPEWTWRSETRPFPDGTRLSGRRRDGVLRPLAVVKNGSWRKINTYVERSIGE